ncbi:VOC family protein [Paenibacillus paeoniae]|uniref:VOC family protein n=1 Tax=Paenibacillus paeoniae TaxID=2292705 RepID=A0A371PIW5_9BACL|nr:VOC family protein [Paenibacillus paeoniae]REK76161.1 VOC family protein [Paenibacillus paeoniae]
MKILRYDHLVLTVASIEQSIRFYGDVLGMEIETFGQNRKAAKFGQQKINFQEVGKEIDPKAKYPVPGSGDFCLITESTPAEVQRYLELKGVPIELGPVQRTGALGPITSIYIRDPDQNLVEISSYTPHIHIR